MPLMLKRFLVSFSLLAAALALPAPGRAAIMYRSIEGWSVEGDASSKVEGSAIEQMKKAEAMEAAGNSAGALNAYRGLVHSHGASVLSPKAQRKIGVILEKSGDPDKAYNAY